MTCIVCWRQSRGFGWFNVRIPRGSPGRYDPRWQFCSRCCQQAFSELMDKTEGIMIDKTKWESMAIDACLAPLGDLVARLGMERPLAAYSRDEVKAMVETIIDAYQESMVRAHEQEARRGSPAMPGTQPGMQPGAPQGLGDVPF